MGKKKDFEGWVGQTTADVILPESVKASEIKNSPLLAHDKLCQFY
jgi:hypothetical protein